MCARGSRVARTFVPQLSGGFRVQLSERSLSLEYMKLKCQLGSPCSLYPIQGDTVPCWDCNKYEGEFQDPGIKPFPQARKDSHIGFSDSEPEPSLSSRPRIKDRRVSYDMILANA